MCLNREFFLLYPGVTVIMILRIKWMKGLLFSNQISKNVRVGFVGKMYNSLYLLHTAESTVLTQKHNSVIINQTMMAKLLV